MIPHEGHLDGWEMRVSFEVLPRTSFTIAILPFSEDSECFCEFSLYDVIWQAVTDRIAINENPKTIASYLRMLADEIEGMCDE